MFLFFRQASIFFNLKQKAMICMPVLLPCMLVHLACTPVLLIYMLMQSAYTPVLMIYMLALLTYTLALLMLVNIELLKAAKITYVCKIWSSIKQIPVIFNLNLSLFVDS